MMARSSARSPSMFTFVRRHVFVTVFGVIAPVLIFICFIGYPIIYTIFLSFYEWNGMTPTKRFVGLANYASTVQRQVLLCRARQ